MGLWVLAVQQAVWNWMKHVWLAGQPEPDFRSAAEFQAAIQYRKTFDAQGPGGTPPGLDYGWVNEYAKDIYDKIHKAFESLDEKADSIIKYLGGGTAILSLVAVANVTSGNALLVFLLLPSLLLAIRAIYFANLARMPAGITLPPPITDAVAYVKAFKTQAQNTFLGLWHEACVGAILAVKQKAAQVIPAKKYFYRALLCLLLPVIVWPVWKLVAPAPPPTNVEVTVPPSKIEIVTPAPQIKVTAP